MKLIDMIFQSWLSFSFIVIFLIIFHSSNFYNFILVLDIRLFQYFPYFSDCFDGEHEQRTSENLLLALNYNIVTLLESLLFLRVKTATRI